MLCLIGLTSLLNLFTMCEAQAGSYERWFQAAKVDNADEIIELLQAGLDPNLIQEERGDTALILALRDDSMRVVTALLKSPDLDLEYKAKNGDNALMIAAFKPNLPAVKALLARGAQVNRPGWTALHYAAAAGEQTIVQLLLDKQARVDALSPNQTTPLMMAARGGHILIVKLLLDHGANPTLVNQQGYDAVAMAKLFNNVEIVEGLNYRIKKYLEQNKSAK
jgi:ankyrin repeat protein